MSGSIGFRLGLVLSLMGLLTAAAILVGNVVFSRTISDVSQLSEHRLPELQQGTELIISTYDLRRGITAVLTAADTAELSDQFDAASQRITDLRGLAAGAGAHAELTHLDKLQQDIARFRDLRAAEFRVGAELESALSAMDTDANNIDKLLKKQMLEGRALLKEGSEKAIADIAETLHLIVDVDMRGLQLALMAKAEINLLAGATLARAETVDAVLVPILQGMSGDALQRLETLLSQMTQNQTIDLDQQALGDILTLFKEVQDANNFMASLRRTEVLDALSESDRLISSAIESILARLDASRQNAESSNSATIRALLSGEVLRQRDRALLDAAVHRFVAGGHASAGAETNLERHSTFSRMRKASTHIKSYRRVAADDAELSAALDRLLEALDQETGVSAIRAEVVRLRAEAVEAAEQAAATVAEAARAAATLGDEARSKIEAASIGLTQAAQTASVWMQAIGGVSLAVFALALVFTRSTVIKPVRRLCQTTERLAGGDLAPVEKIRWQAGEISRMSTALTVFRDGLVRKIEMEKEAEDRTIAERRAAEKAEAEKRRREEEERQREDRRAAEAAAREAREQTEREALRAQADAERRKRTQEQENLVATLAAGLTRLAGGELDTRIEAPFPDAYEALRHDFNRAVDTLSDVIRQISATAESIDGSSGEMSAAATDMSERTERTAGTLEETATALNQLTSAVASAAENAERARSTASDASTRATAGQEVVERTAEAMTRIENSSEKIAQITGLIEDIAFQTNLLALNAGVEAARAGDAGRGFAVVATEVRGLAHRSSEAAKEISGLISESETSVRLGADLVQQTGTALTEIAESITLASGMVEDIAVSAKSQAEGVAEINHSVSDLDQATQRNAALSEETSALVTVLNTEASSLAEIVRGFQLPDGTANDQPIQDADAPAGLGRAL